MHAYFESKIAKEKHNLILANQNKQREYASIIRSNAVLQTRNISTASSVFGIDYLELGDTVIPTRKVVPSFIAYNALSSLFAVRIIIPIVK
jgi:hypothetical protein